MRLALTATVHRMDPSGNTRRPGLHDVARLAGCSYQTVSRVVNNTGAVSDNTRSHVMAAIAELGYRRNGAALALRTAKAGAIGVVTHSSWRYGPMGVLHGIETAAREAGKHLLLSVEERDSFASLKATLDSFREAFVDGIIVIAPIVHEAEQALKMIGESGWASALPIVVLAADITSLPHATVISEDQAEGARMAVGHLADLGHDSIGHVAGDQDWLEGRARLLGWKSELEARNLRVSEPIFGDWSGESGFEAGQKIAAMADPPTAVFVASDLMALGVMRAFRKRGIRVPEDVSLVGFDDHEFAAQFDPPLTTIRQDFAALGRLCIATLNDLGTHGARIISPKIIVRESTATPPTR